MTTETDEPNHYTVPGSIVCSTILQALHTRALGLHGWLALSWAILHPQGVYSHWAHNATCTIRVLRQHVETSTL